ncbi:hypothetical protein PVAP13_1NG093100 [Panicum virgatum]|uniref:Secreted protein n=1 Tax=Panicum virgatum TaxID=38727 RepID=A0A8T0WQD2_PANVG|nr:hypothetical protein PVAP13_1NG093100 [Panicum virgatum]
MAPVMLLLAMCRRLSSSMPPIAAGMLPVRPLLSASTSSLRLAQRVMLPGMAPASALPRRLRYRRRRREPTLRGISPRRLLKLRLSERRKVRLPMAGEMVPSSPRERRSRDTTRHRWRWPRPQVTPAQLQ